MTITLSTIGSQCVTIEVTPAALPAVTQRWPRAEHQSNNPVVTSENGSSPEVGPTHDPS